MPSLAERIAYTALAKFDALPPNCKPRTLPDGETEWTPMSAVVLANDEEEGGLICVSLATGTKCLSLSALPRCRGLVLHDSHAEVLALRGFNLWVLSEVRAIVEDPAYQSRYLEPIPREVPLVEDDMLQQTPPFKIKDRISIHFFTTEAPCGDASMDLLMESFPTHLATPWSTDPDSSDSLQGRGHFSLLGYVRRKPARADAEASLSKSCTDKLAVKQFTSVLSFPADLFVQKSPNAYIQSLVVYSGQYHAAGYERAFGSSGRLSKLNKIGLFFAFAPLPDNFPPFPFDKKQRISGEQAPGKRKASNISVLWVKGSDISRPDKVEILIKGVKQGYKQWDQRLTKASATSRKALWGLALDISRISCHHETTMIPSHLAWEKDRLIAVREAISLSTYEEAKSSPLRAPIGRRRMHVTDVMGNWTRNGGDGDWSYSGVAQSVLTG